MSDLSDISDRRCCILSGPPCIKWAASDKFSRNGTWDMICDRYGVYVTVAGSKWQYFDLFVTFSLYSRKRHVHVYVPRNCFVARPRNCHEIAAPYRESVWQGSYWAALREGVTAAYDVDHNVLVVDGIRSILFWELLAFTMFTTLFRDLLTRNVSLQKNQIINYYFTWWYVDLCSL